MNYININNKSQIINFQDAVICQNHDSGLIMPQYIPEFDNSFIKKLNRKTNKEIATDLMYPYLNDLIDKRKLKNLISESLNFKIPLVQVEDNIFALELFHGPTMAFKDVGALFLSSLLQHLNPDMKKIRVIVATSGDTGSAVANSFANVPGFEVLILFPKGGVSLYQEQQLTNTASNVKAVEVDGTFDDCQLMLKKVLKNKDLCNELNITTANSINIGRLLPQIVYYFLAYKQLVNKKKDVVFSVPCGNLGNLTAGLMAMKMGLPVAKFIAAVNRNQSFYKLLKYGTYHPNETIKTFSNAMDVSNPSNIVRILHLYEDDILRLKEDIQCKTVNDDETISSIRAVYKKFDYLMDPHSAVAYHSLKSSIKKHQNGIFLATASPHKFESIVSKAIPSLIPKKIEYSNGYKIKSDTHVESLQSILYELALA
ncbi:MAG: threonine synthase [Bacteroidetes bacterium]|nr:threonine synthase [Bacteroidota bacterium]